MLICNDYNDYNDSMPNLISIGRERLFYGSPELKRKCHCCNEWKTFDHFEDREDGWGLYSWCQECRKDAGRLRVPRGIKWYINKTRLFVDNGRKIGRGTPCKCNRPAMSAKV